MYKHEATQEDMIYLGEGIAVAYKPSIDKRMLDYETSIKAAGEKAARKRLRSEPEQEADTVTEEKMTDVDARAGDWSGGSTSWQTTRTSPRTSDAEAESSTPPEAPLASPCDKKFRWGDFSNAEPEPTAENDEPTTADAYGEVAELKEIVAAMGKRITTLESEARMMSHTLYEPRTIALSNMYSTSMDTSEKLMIKVKTVLTDVGMSNEAENVRKVEKVEDTFTLIEGHVWQHACG